MQVKREHLTGLQLALSIADTVCTDSISVSELQRLIAEAQAAPGAEPVATYMGTDWTAQSQFLAECASLEPGTELFATPLQDADLYREWFNAVQDLNPKFLEPADYAAAARLTPKSAGCGAKLAAGQYFTFCGETDMGQSMPALCGQCGGRFKCR